MNASSSLRIVVTGLAVTYPYGGVFWDYMQYVLGLLRLGHDVLYLEDTGRWCYDPVQQTFVESGGSNAAFFAGQLARFDPALADRWFYRDAQGQTHGWSVGRMAEFCASADLLLHISASCWLRDDYLKARRIAFIDSDPMYTQASLLAGGDEKAAAEKIAWWKEHHQKFFTFGENLGQPDCLVPTGPLDWIPTRQPIVLDSLSPHRVPVAQRRRVLTTVASWEPTEKGPVYLGSTYGGKSLEFQKFISLPQQTVLPVEVAISGPAPKEQLSRQGWLVRDALEVSGDPWVYRDYLARSFAECSVAKNAYVASRSGWFSCRTACYLALGVPAIVQETGFSRFIPSGLGLLAFSSVQQARAAIESVACDPQKHSQAAMDLAREYFDSAKVLSRLVESATAD